MMNILCYADVAEKHPITATADQFVVHLPDHDVKFVLKNKLYIADFNDWNNMNIKQLYFSSVSEMASLYYSKERKFAWEACQFIQRSLYGSKEEVINLATNGNIRGINFTRNDIERAYIIYGKPTASIQGRMTKKSIARVELEQTSNWEARPQTLTMDTMFVGTIPFPCYRYKCTRHDHRKQTSRSRIHSLLGQLQQHIDTYNTCRFDVKHIIDVHTIFSDADKSARSIADKLPGIKLDIGGPGAYADRADERIRSLKELCRQTICSLPFKLPEFLLEDMVKYANIRLNMFLGHNRAVSPKVDFSGLKPRIDREYALSFGEYCLVRDPAAKSNDVHSPRAKSCIALFPDFNSHGSWQFYCLDTHRRLSSPIWDTVPTPQLVIDKINDLAGTNTVPKDVFGAGTSGVVITDQAFSGGKKEVLGGKKEVQDTKKEVVRLKKNVTYLRAPTEKVVVKSAASPAFPSANLKADSPAKTTAVESVLTKADPSAEVLTFEVEVEKAEPSAVSTLPAKAVASAVSGFTPETPFLSGKESVSAVKAIINNENLELRRSTRVNAGVAKPRFGHESKEVNVTRSLPDENRSSNFHISVAKGLKEIGLPAEKAIMAELKQFIDLKVFEPVKNASSKIILRSSMFITEKLDGQGNHLKWKAPMVADGSMQEKQLYENNSSPTIDADAVKCFLKIAKLEKRK